MSKSINPMYSLFPEGEPFGLAPGPIVLMSLQPAIPWRDALQQSPPPLHRPVSIFRPTKEICQPLLFRRSSILHWTSSAGRGKILTLGGAKLDDRSGPRRMIELSNSLSDTLV